MKDNNDIALWSWHRGLNGIGIGANRGGYDKNALAFIAAAQLTSSTQKAAINAFVKELKKINEVQAGFVNFDTPSESILLACYPCVGGTADKHKFNLVNPADTDAAFRITWSGGLTHGAFGVKGDGTNGIGQTHLSASLIGTDNHGIDQCIAGGAETANSWTLINGSSPYVYINSAGGLSFSKLSRGASNDQSTYIVRKNEYNSSQLICVNRKSNLANGCDIYFTGIKTTIAAATANVPHASNFTLMSVNGSFPSKSYVQYTAIRKAGISDAAMLLYIDAINNLNYNLGRLSNKNLVFEGHSFFHNQPAGSSVDWAVEQTVARLNSNYDDRIYSYVASAVSGSVIQDLINRKATAVDPYKVTKWGMKNIILLWVGANDVTATAGTGATAYAKLKSYYNSLIADGWTPIIITMTPIAGGTGQREIERDTFNNSIRTDLVPTYLYDTDTVTELSDSTNTTYFQGDQIHLTKAGNLIASLAISNIIKSI